MKKTIKLEFPGTYKDEDYHATETFLSQIPKFLTPKGYEVTVSTPPQVKQPTIDIKSPDIEVSAMQEHFNDIFKYIRSLIDRTSTEYTARIPQWQEQIKEREDKIETLNQNLKKTKETDESFEIWNQMLRMNKISKENLEKALEQDQVNREKLIKGCGLELIKLQQITEQLNNQLTNVQSAAEQKGKSLLASAKGFFNRSKAPQSTSSVSSSPEALTPEGIKELYKSNKGSSHRAGKLFPDKKIKEMTREDAIKILLDRAEEHKEQHKKEGATEKTLDEIKPGWRMNAGKK